MQDYEKKIVSYKSHLKVPRKTTKERFKIITVSRWVCDEMIVYIREHLKSSPLEAAINFRKAMEYGAVYNKNNSGKFYSIAEDTAQDIIDHVFY